MRETGRIILPVSIYVFLVLTIGILTACQPETSLPTPTSIGTRKSGYAPISKSTLISTNSPFPTLKPSPLPSVTLISTITATPIVVGPSRFPSDINPLTGLPLSDPDLLDRLPILVKVSNFPREGRPQAGLSFADIVFEHYIGEGTNRFTALFYGRDSSQVGPIRSARLVDAQLTRLYQGIFAYAAADPNAVFPALDKWLGKRAINAAPATCPALCDIGPHSIYSVFTDTSRLIKYSSEKLSIPMERPDLDGMAFSTIAPISTQPANQVGVIFNAWDIGIWQYNQATELYDRWIETVDSNNNVGMVPLTDRQTGQQLAFSNVMIVFVTYRELAPTLHEIMLWDNQKGSRAVLFRDGRAYEGTWKTTSNDHPIEFFSLQGQPLRFKPGATWMILAGNNSSLQSSSPGQWEMHFALP